MEINRLAAFEKMLKAIVTQYEQTSRRMAELKLKGKEKTATYRQLFASKLQLQAMLSCYQAHGLIDRLPDDGLPEA